MTGISYHPKCRKGCPVKERIDQFCMVPGMGNEPIDENYADMDFNCF